MACHVDCHAGQAGVTRHMDVSHVIALLSAATAFRVSGGLLRCSQVLQAPQPQFQLVRTCSHSQAAVIASDRSTTFTDCQRLAVGRRGLALNFADPRDLEDEYQDSCLVYDCPEFDPSLLQEDTDYDYYSIYTDIDLERNVTCVPLVGLFQLVFEPANFSEAVSTCNLEGGQLASITSAERTNHLSVLVASLGPAKSLHLAYVGMHDRDREGFFVTVADEPLNCFPFRGWAPGHPRARQPAEDCVVMDSRRSWRVVNCNERLPFICELLAEIPDPCNHVRRKNFKQKCRAETDLNRRRKRKNFERCSHQDSFY